MASHITTRMAWHDNKWNGKICQYPDRNHYCTGVNSLLSQRINKNKNAELEKKYAGKPLDSVPNYIPPCYWSSSAFSQHSVEVFHTHPFPQFKNRNVRDTLPAFSIFSWPFRLSFNHGATKIEQQGSYKSGLRDLVKRFCDKFEPKSTLVFFYLNYDNPVSGEEKKYTVVGFSLLLDEPEISGDFPLSDEEVSKIQHGGKNMKNFSRLNWSIKVTTDFPGCGVLLPYHEYLAEAQKDPKYWKLLDEIKVLVEEDSLNSSFKYVMSDIDEDQAILLLSKIKKASDKVKEHGLVDFSNESKIIDDQLEKAWKRRGLYPGLGKLLDFIGSNKVNGEKILTMARKRVGREAEVLEYVFNLITNREIKIPAELVGYENQIALLRREIRQYTALLPLLRKLSLFDLKPEQLRDVLTKREHFRRRPDNAEIYNNPYVLCEEYQYSLSKDDLDKEVIPNGPIDPFRIDIGMFPSEALGFNIELHNLSQYGKERLRPIIMNFLSAIGTQGDCYSGVDSIYEHILNNPLFFESMVNFNKEQLMSKDYLDHFSKKLYVEENEGNYFFYLREVRAAEDMVRGIVSQLVSRKEHKADISSIDTYLDKSIKELVQRGLTNFDQSRFKEERRPVLEGAQAASLYVVTGSAGTGKSRILEELVSYFDEAGERTIVLTPTGKASIRLKKDANLEGAQTIDRYVFSTGDNNREILNDFRAFTVLKPERQEIDNLILDECSMIDLAKFATVLNLVRVDGESGLKRLILVGDENQLPPIGFGKPFYDIIQYLKEKKSLRERHFSKLLTNCRSKSDQVTLKIAEAFTDSKYYNEEMDSLLLGGSIAAKGIELVDWDGYDSLNSLVDHGIELLASESALTKTDLKSSRMFTLLGLYENGYVKNGDCSGIDNFQILAPFKAGVGGTLSINGFIEDSYSYTKHNDDKFQFKSSPFYHAEKIINTQNEYHWNRENRRSELRLTNGSIGIINNKKDKFGKVSRTYYFTDQDGPLYNVNEDHLEPAYAISVHKSQGSDFDNVFFIVPDSTQPLSRELFYTAITRGKMKVKVFLPQSDRKELIEKIRRNSEVLHRNTSIFTSPGDYKRYFSPTEGINVRSKVEYIIYKALEAAGLEFRYEEPLSLAFHGKTLSVKPDFTILLPRGKKVYWEHLGELDVKGYSLSWSNRVVIYKENGLTDFLLTTDDIYGIRDESLAELINDLRNNRLAGDVRSGFSEHHYRLYD